ncbi:hypothetical protein PR202_ga00731 [Eleusine coracana subsp. coracana]|uniref:MADS-box domain-containing protein n=1 Tax=Eleusine coracana subsp. coracana TaxID=191504 RepID=A0AAV5BEU0_ELECO|nr:hypothetical protein QOZ80_2AG0130740 [Eleusine coracana subsp. coracana]GJM85004.1 hypothetical protein PR202_ga00731 [Eleusine coracana subsp. coracana]
MARRKLHLQYILKNSARRATFKKRRANLLKKASELATLCDVDACVVVYGEGESRPEVWPPSATEATRILGRFQAMPETDRCYNMMDMEAFLTQRIAKLKQQLEKARRDNHERETALLLNQVIAGRRPGLVGLSKEELESLGSMVQRRIEDVENAKKLLDEKEESNPALAAALQLPEATLLLEPPVPYTAVTGNMEVDAPELDPRGWLLDVTNKAGGIGGGENGSFGGDLAGASTSGGGFGDMFQLGNTMAAGFPWADHEPFFPPAM